MRLDKRRFQSRRKNVKRRRVKNTVAHGIAFQTVGASDAAKRSISQVRKLNGKAITCNTLFVLKIFGNISQPVQ